MEEKGLWDRKVGMMGVVAIALVSLLVGLGVSGHLDWFTASRGANLLGATQSGETRPAVVQGLPDFITLAKRIENAKVKTAVLVCENVLVDSSEDWTQNNMRGSTRYNVKCAAFSRLR